MISKLLDKRNLNNAFKKVVSNQGSPGVDGVSCHQLKDYLLDQGAQMISRVRSGSYLPQPIKGVSIPKPNGKSRLLGVPTVGDRMLQQALLQVLEPLFEPDFRPHSYGFRPQRNAHQAVQQSLQYINQGYQEIIDIDLKNFFDEVSHSILLELIYKKVKCHLTMRLLRRFLRAPIQIDGKLYKRRKGVPQGSPLSPLLSNILLNELDKELEKRGLRYVRYADDFSIYLRSNTSATRVGKGIFKFLT